MTARRLGVPAETVREWQKTYRAIGKDGLLAMGVKQARYDYETKVAAARAMVDGGMSKPEAMVRFSIASATPLKKWCRLYREGGAQAHGYLPVTAPVGSARKNLSDLGPQMRSGWQLGVSQCVVVARPGKACHLEEITHPVSMP